MHQRLQLLFNLYWWEKEGSTVSSCPPGPGGWEHGTEGPLRPTGSVRRLSLLAEQPCSRLWTLDPTHCVLSSI